MYGEPIITYSKEGLWIVVLIMASIIVAGFLIERLKEHKKDSTSVKYEEANESKVADEDIYEQEIEDYQEDPYIWEYIKSPGMGEFYPPECFRNTKDLLYGRTEDW